MTCVRSGQARPDPWLLTGVPAVVSRVERDFACKWAGRYSSCAGCPAGAVALGAGGAGTYTERVIPGSDLFRVRSPQRSGLRAASQVVMPMVLSESDLHSLWSSTAPARGGHAALGRP
jgi:hypothetical protein